MIDRSLFLQSMDSYQAPPMTERQIENFERYADMLVEWNQKMNLTAITDPRGIVLKHFVDSLLPLIHFDPPQRARIVDVGAGAGFPSLPMKIVRPDLELTFLDSLKKRLGFLEAVCGELNLEAEYLHGRAEDMGRSDLRESYDVVTARAVAALAKLSEYCLPLCGVGGTFLALKGGDVAEEMEQGKSAIKKLGGEIIDIKPYNLPDGDARNLIIIKKISQTPPKYPRQAAKIDKSPL